MTTPERPLQLPTPQTDGGYPELFGDLQALYASRYNEVVENMTDPTRSFTASILHAVEDSMYVNTGDDERSYSVIRLEEMSLSDFTNKYFRTIFHEVNPDGTLPPDQISSKAIDLIAKESQKVDVPIQIRFLGIVGIIAASYKRAKSTSPDVSANNKADKRDDAIFNKAVSVLKSHVLAPAQDETIARNLDNLIGNLSSYRNSKAARAQLAINRLGRGRYAQQILYRLMDEGTTSRTINDEMEIVGSHLPTPKVTPIPVRKPSQEVPDPKIIGIDWDFFTPDTGEARGPMEIVPERHPMSAEKKAQLDLLRKIRLTTIARLIADNGGKAFGMMVKLGEVGDAKHVAAVLPREEGKVDVVVESLVPDRAMYALRHEDLAGAVIDTSSPEALKKTMKQIFDPPRRVAVGHGATKIVHRKNNPDLYDIALDYLTQPVVPRSETSSEHGDTPIN